MLYTDSQDGKKLMKNNRLSLPSLAAIIVAFSLSGCGGSTEALRLDAISQLQAGNNQAAAAQFA